MNPTTAPISAQSHIEETYPCAPVLFVIFKRKDTSLRVLDAIRQARPQRLYIAADGARPHVAGEAEAVAETRKAILDAIDWPCDVKTLWRDHNVGCAQGVKGAVDWLFDNEEMGIIIEDDVVAKPTFFTFATAMLHRYAHDTRIGMISGNNEVAEKYQPDSAYLYSEHKSAWGWATWRRAWRNMDFEMSWRSHDPDVVIKSGGGISPGLWRFRLKMIDGNHVSAWDWQWYATLCVQHQLCIFPRVNMITNVGDDEFATHTAATATAHQAYDLQPPYAAPNAFSPDRRFAREVYRIFNTPRLRLGRMLPHSLKQRLKKLL